MANGIWHHSLEFPVRDWHGKLITLAPSLQMRVLNVLVYVDTASRLTQTLPCGCPNQTATIRGLEKQSKKKYFLQIDSDQGLHFKGHIVQDWAKTHDMEQRCPFSEKPQAARLVERKDGILRQHIKQLTGKTTLYYPRLHFCYYYFLILIYLFGCAR